MKRYSPGLLLRRLRAAKQMTQEILANISGIDYRHLQSIEADKIDIRLSTAAKLASALDVPLCHMVQPLTHPDISDLGFSCSEEIIDELCIGLVVCGADGLIRYQNKWINNVHGRCQQKLSIYELISSQNEANTLKRGLKGLATAAHRTLSIQSTLKSVDNQDIQVIGHWQYLPGSHCRPSGFIGVLSSTHLLPAEGKK